MPDVYQPPVPHRCYPPLDAWGRAGRLVGAIWRCDECGRHWRVGRSDGWELVWERVRWWHLGVRRKIRAAQRAEVGQ